MVYLDGRPCDVAVLLSIELCSLTFQRDDASTANLVGSGFSPITDWPSRTSIRGSRIPGGPNAGGL